MIKIMWKLHTRNKHPIWAVFLIIKNGWSLSMVHRFQTAGPFAQWKYWDNPPFDRPGRWISLHLGRCESIRCCFGRFWWWGPFDLPKVRNSNQNKGPHLGSRYNTLRIHVWYIYLCIHVGWFFMGNVGKYTMHGSSGNIIYTLLKLI